MLVRYDLNMCILITGDRHWRCDDLAEQVLNRLLARYGPRIIVVHGGAPGVDQTFAVAGTELGITLEPYLADGTGSDTVAGPMRNRPFFVAQSPIGGKIPPGTTARTWWTGPWRAIDAA
jgi:hypothetical protein